MAGSALHTILTPVRGDGKGDNVLAHAAVLARKFGARVRVVHCHPKTEDLMPFGVVVPRLLRDQIEQAAQSSADATRDQLVAEFRELAGALGLAEQDYEAGTPTTRFIEYEGKQVDAVKHFGRVSDLICVPQPCAEQNLGSNTLKAALFTSGRPVLMCPPQDQVNDSFYNHVAIAWNGSLEATRAVGLGMPLIEAASKVTILSTGDAEHRATAEELRRYLELKEVASQVHEFTAKSGTVGGQILDEAGAVGAGMLVMGAYHTSYDTETLFGGNSQMVVDGAKIPVLMVH